MAMKRDVLNSGKGERRQFDTYINGRFVAFDCKVEPWRDGSGNIVGLLVAATDITPIREAGSAASGFNTHTLATPVALNAALATTIAWNCGRAGGAAATSLQFVYDEDGFAGTNCDVAHWTDDGRVWSDFCDEQGYTVQTEYQGRASNGSTMPIGDPTEAWPNPFAIDSGGTTDAAPLNAPRQAIRVVRTGITVAVN
jgi:hypothetical protein